MEDHTLQALAHLAGLHLSGDQARRRRADMEVLLHSIERLFDLDITGTIPAYHPHRLSHRQRPDEPCQPTPRNALLAQAPRHHRGFVVAPAAIDAPNDSRTSSSTDLSEPTDPPVSRETIGDDPLNAFIAAPAPSIDSGEPPWPVAIKDNICTASMPTTAGSSLLRNYQPTYDATAVGRLLDAGATAFGKTNLDEFAMGGASETSFAGPVKNPHDPTRVAGGSSGGSAAAVAADLCPLALGSDTGGSVRIPAAFCGVIGFRPTWGRVSRHGLISFASSLDQIGLLSRHLDHIARAFTIIEGRDSLDATSRRPLDPDHSATFGDRPTIGLLPMGADVTDAVSHHFERWRRRAHAQGARFVELDLPVLRYATATYQVIATAEAASNLNRYDAIRYGTAPDPAPADATAYRRAARSQGFGDEVQRRLLLGHFILREGHHQAYLDRAYRIRHRIIQTFQQAFQDVDLIATPTAPSTAFPIGQRTGDPLASYREDCFAIPASLAGLPAISLPMGHSPDGLPTGLQLIAPTDRDEALLHAASTLHPRP